MPAQPGQPFFLDFESLSGALSLDSPDSTITVIEITSSSGVFTGTVPAAFDGLFDVLAPGKAFHLNPDGFQTLDMEQAVTAGTPPEMLASDLCYSGAVMQGGRLGALYVRSGDAVHPVSCGAPSDSVDLAAALDPDADIGVFVDPEGGNLIVQVPGDPDGAFKPLTQFEITANSDVFLPGNKISGTLDGASDVLTNSRLLKIDEHGFGTIDFGPILRDGASLGDLETVFSVTAMFDGGEVADSVQLVNLAVVPEPANGFLLLLPALFLMRRRTR